MTRIAHSGPSIIIKKSRSAREELTRRRIMRVSAKDVLKGALELEKQGFKELGGMALIGMAKTLVFQRETQAEGQGAVTAGSKERSTKAGYSPYFGVQNYVPNPFNLSLFSDIVMFSTIHTTCLQTLCNDIVGNGWKIESSDDKQQEDALMKWLKKVNDTGETITDVLLKMLVDRFLTGNWCCEIVADNANANIIEMNYVNSNRINPHRTVFMRENNFTPVVPLFQYKEGQGIKPIYFKKYEEQREWDAFDGILATESTPSNRFATELIWNMEYFPSLAPYYGLPLVVPGWSASEAFNHQRVYNLSWFETMGIKVAVMVKGQLDEKGEEYINDYIEGESTGEALKTLFLYSPTKDVEFDIQNISASTTEASFTALNDQAMREIFMLWRVPPYRAGATIDVGALGGNYVKESSRIYVSTVLSSKQEDLENMVNKIIHSERGFTTNLDVKFKLNSIDITDMELLLKEVDIGMRYALLRRCEAAKLLGIGNFAEGEGQEYLIEQGLVPWEMAGQITGNESSMLKQLEISMRRQIKT